VKYGVPSDAPIKFSRSEALRPGVAAVTVEPTTVGQASDKGSSPANDKADLAAGQELFNGTCGHCHGPNAVQSERKIDVRILRKPEGEDMEKTYWKTVNDGRPSKGMPAWKEVFNEDQLKSVYVYLQSVQDSGS